MNGAGDGDTSATGDSIANGDGRSDLLATVGWQFNCTSPYSGKTHAAPTDDTTGTITIHFAMRLISNYRSRKDS